MREQEARELGRLFELGVGAGLERDLERRLTAVVLRVGVRAVREQRRRVLRDVRHRGLVERRAVGHLRHRVDVAAELAQHVERAAARARPDVQRGPAVFFGRVDVGALRDEPAREVVGTVRERERRVFDRSTSPRRVDVAGLEDGLEPVEVTRLEQRLEVLRQGLALRHHARG